MNARPVAPSSKLDWNQLVRDHLTRSWWLTLWLLVLAYGTLRFLLEQWSARPAATGVVLLLWVGTLFWTVWGELNHRHNPLTYWLRHNLYSSITNALLTLIIVLALIAIINALYRYAWTSASLTTIPATDMRAEVADVTETSICFRVGQLDAAAGPTALTNVEQRCFPAAAYVPDLSQDDPRQVKLGETAAAFCFDEQPGDSENGLTCFASDATTPGFFTVTTVFSGANWGAVRANLTTLMVFRFTRAELWRVWVSVIGLILLLALSWVVYSGRLGRPHLRRVVTRTWYISPLVLYILLRGAPAPPFPTDNLGAIIGGLGQTLFAWQMPTFPPLPGWMWLATALAPLLLAVNGWVNRRWPTSSDAGRLGRYARLAWQVALVGVTLLALWTLGRWVGPLVWANRALFALVGIPLLYLAGRRFSARYPAEKGESEARRLGRLALSFAYGIFLVLGALAGLQLLFLIVGAITWRGEQVFVPLNPDVDWGGFLLTLIITAFAIVVSFPLGVALALGRRSKIPGVPAWLTYGVAALVLVWGLRTQTPHLVATARNELELALAYWPLLAPVIAYLFQRVWQGNVVAAFSTLYIEFIRGIPLITVLFLTIILFPIFLPPNVEILGTWRVMWGFTLFSAAYLAENVRGGLQAIPKGQYEAADSLGLSTVAKYRLIILPQALRTVIPTITNQYIGLFKDTTLVAIVGLLDILGVANAIAAQPAWLGVRREAYLFIAVLYYVISAAMVRYSDRLEKQTGLGER